MTREELAQDLAYARALAEEGRHAPLLGGAFMVFWGGLNLSAYLVHWGLLTDALPRMGGASFAYLWIGYGVIAGIGSTLLGKRVRQLPGRTSIGARAERAMWLGVGLALSAIVVGSILRMALDHDANAPNTIMGAGFALFGTALLGTSMLSEQRWLSGFAVLSFVVAAVLNFYANAPWAYLLAAGASAVVVIAPGLVLLKNEPPAAV